MILLLAASASADLPYAYVKVQPDLGDLVVIVFPHRDGQVYLRDTGLEIDATAVQVGHTTDDPWGECQFLSPMPEAQSIVVQPMNEIDGLTLLDHPIGLEGPAGADGWTTVELGQLRGGGHSSGLQSFRAAVPGHEVCLFDTQFALEVRSPDVNGDLVVDLTDITLFVSALGEYATYADFNADGYIGLADIVSMAQALGDED